MAQAATPRRAVRFGLFELDLGSGELRRAGLKVKLQEQPFQVLAMLLDHPGDLVSREELRSRLWPADTFVDFDHGLNVAVKKLRHALGDSADNPRFIETLARRGYRFIAPVDGQPSADAGQAATTPSGLDAEKPAALGGAKEIEAKVPSVVKTVPAQRADRHLLYWAVAVVLVAAAGIAAWIRWRGRSASPSVTRFTIPLPQADQFSMHHGGLAISPDGTHVVYCATSSKNRARQLYLRAMDRNEAVPIPGTEEAVGPFFSPDGQWIAFSARGQLKKVSLHGGAPIALCETVNSTTGSWRSGDAIFFTEGAAPEERNARIMRVPAAGGTPLVVTPAGKTESEVSPRWPEALPTGDAILYAAGGTAPFSEDVRIVAQSLKTGERKVLIQGGTFPRYVSTGHIIYAQAGRLFAVPFDLQRLEVTGPAFLVLDDVWQGSAGYAAYDISRSGSLVSVTRGESNILSTLNWVDRAGVSQPISAAANQYNQPRLSPDGKRLAVTIGDPMQQTNIWVLDLDRNSMIRLNLSERARAPLWTPDGSRLIYTAGPHASSLFWKAADGSGTEELLLSGDVTIFPTACSPDSQLLMFQRGDVRHFDFWLLNLSGERKAQAFMENSFAKTQAQISPDGRWFAYTSGESGILEVYVQPFPALGSKFLVSIDGGEEPRWSGDGRELFYRRGDKMMVVDIQSKRVFNTSRPRLLFEGPYAMNGRTGSFLTNYDVAPDGQHFLMLKEEEDQRQAQQELSVVLNWTEELKRRINTGTN